MKYKSNVSSLPKITSLGIHAESPFGTPYIVPRPEPKPQPKPQKPKK
ncbi:MAG: hypothetical protein K0U41_01515 [Gammaproteobacteria bacterium]|nr:hypothetical protein [Gammaproteobacteria bacterium]